MGSREARMKQAIVMMRKYLKNEELCDFIDFVHRQSNVIGSKSSVEIWVKLAQKSLPEEEYNEFVKKVYPLDGNSEEVIELKAKLSDMANRIAKHKATLYDVIDELNISMSEYVYLLKRLKYRQKELGAAIYEANLEYYNKVSSYLKPNELTCSYPTLGKDMNDRLVAFIEEYNLPVNNVTYTEAYDTFKNRGIIKSNNR